MDIELRLLRHARALAEHRNYARAARALRLSQPSLSRSIRALEAQVGARLFDRGRSGAEPTDAGRVFLDHAAAVLARADDMSREMRLLRGLDVGELTVGAGTYPSEMLVASAVARLVRLHPDVRVRVVTDNWAALMGLVRRRDVDLAVADASTARGDGDLRVAPLLRHQGYFVVRRGHPLLVRARIALADVLRFPFVGVSRLPPRLLEPLLRAAPASSVPARQTARSIPSVACDSPSAIRTIVAGSDSVGLLPLSLIGVPGEVPRLEVLPLVEPWLYGEFAVIRLASRSLSPLGEEFARLVREADAEVRAAEERLAGHFLRAAPGDRGPGARPTPSPRRRGPSR